MKDWCEEYSVLASRKAEEIAALRKQCHEAREVAFIYRRAWLNSWEFHDETIFKMETETEWLAKEIKL